MCTVSYIPLNNDEFVITSNRDEKSPRNAHELKEVMINEARFIFPVDPLSNGTWIGISQAGRTCCLLNGGKEIHFKKSKYRKSRGLVFLDFLSSLNLSGTIQNYDLNEIEPFTLIINEHLEDRLLLEFIWDGEKKHISQLDFTKPKLWASVTLYDNYNIECKNKLFNDLVIKEINQNDILDFHLSSENILTPVHSAGPENRATTISVTQITGNSFETKIRHYDILNSKSMEDYLTTLLPFYA